MPRLGSKIWYGTFSQETDLHRPHILPWLAWIAVITLVLGIRYSLPFECTDALTVHQRILDSLAAGQVWGRQALVGTAEFPLLTTAAMLFAEQLGTLVKLPAGHVLVGVSQVWAVVYLIRIPKTPRARCLIATLVPIFFATPEFRAMIFALDPNWITAVPAVAAFYHLTQWFRYNALRDVVLLAVNGGLLVFAGPTGMCIAVVFLIVTSTRIHHINEQWSGHDLRGVHFLTWAPFVYCCGLILLANWLIMRDLVFILRHTTNAPLSANIDELLTGTAQGLSTLPWLAAAGIVTTGLGIFTRKRTLCASLFATLAGISLIQAVYDTLNVHLPAGRLILGTLGIAALATPIMLYGVRKGPRLWHGIAALLMILAVTAEIKVSQHCFITHANLIQRHPHRAHITAWVDKAWEDARIMVYGTLTPAIYFDPKERRFVSRLDFSARNLLWRARDEQLYLLVPPANGRFYPNRNNAMARIHEHGAPWLLLEQTWRPGWQLWRCVVLPTSVENTDLQTPSSD
ncbi:MAG: hypothetical protein K9N51_05420 [Candidatus Pacebacteria bacterium]|nr:hypothetical protein [Candidatus Paceibacterota bacterium]